MKRALQTRRLALLLPILAAAAFAPDAALADHRSSVTGPHDTAMALRLADGSSIRVPCDKAAARVHCPGSASVESASLSADSRRTPIKRLAQVFDARARGVVAGIRG